MVGHLYDLVADILEVRVLRPQIDDVFGRRPVRFREHDIERHHRRARLAQPIDELGDLGTRPRPLANLLKRRIVDIDDTDTGIGVEFAWPRSIPVIAG